MSEPVQLAIALAAVALALLTFWIMARRLDRGLPQSIAPKVPHVAPIAPPDDLFPGPEVTERIGLVLVHGIGEQTRFEHLSTQLRDLVDALQRQHTIGPVLDMTVEIAGSSAAALHAVQDSWAGGSSPSVVVILRHTLRGAARETRVFVHEVWWADVNERYSLAKQFRFWLWGLSIWAHPARLRSGLGSASDVRPPSVPNHSFLWDRLRLFLVGAFFALFGFSAGLLTFFVTRVFGVQAPRVVRTMSNYISAVKLYNQGFRYGPGLLWPHDEFLDTIGEPPRVSVRRRMIRTLADVACGGYHRWYVLAHSQGSVVAFNGLMETAYTWPGYLDERRWLRLKRRGMAGPARTGWVAPVTPTMPRRPVWAAADEIAYRPRIMRRCCGWLTYGAPLETFAGIWPALVPISKEPAFHDRVVWLNLLDRLDPVAGRALGFAQGPAVCCPIPIDQAYASSGPLLVTHVNYLTQRLGQADAATQVIQWLLAGLPAPLAPPGSRLWYGPGGAAWERRYVWAWLTWFAAAFLLLVAASLVVPWLWGLAGAALSWKLDKVPLGKGKFDLEMFSIVMVRVAALVLWLPLLIGLGAQRYFHVPAMGTDQNDASIVTNMPPEGDRHWRRLRDARLFRRGRTIAGAATRRLRGPHRS